MLTVAPVAGSWAGAFSGVVELAAFFSVSMAPGPFPEAKTEKSLDPPALPCTAKLTTFAPLRSPMEKDFDLGLAAGGVEFVPLVD